MCSRQQVGGFELTPRFSTALFYFDFLSSPTPSSCKALHLRLVHHRSLPTLRQTAPVTARFNVNHRTLAIWRVYCSAAITGTMGTFLIVLRGKIITPRIAHPTSQRRLAIDEKPRREL